MKNNVSEHKAPSHSTPPAPAPTASAAPAAEAPAAAAAGNGPAPAQLQELQQQTAKAEENWQRLLRTTADFENFKKRAAREKQDAAKFANESLLQQLIPVLDSFEGALAATQNSQDAAVQAVQKGVKMVFQQLKTTLQQAGLEEIDATGQVFDPHQHEAVAQQESADIPEGHVLQQLRKGFKLRERLLRPATVIVAKPKA